MASAGGPESMPTSSFANEPMVAKYFYWCFAGLELVLFYYAMRYARKYPKYPAFLFPPFICGCLMFDNIVMATTGMDKSKQSVNVNMVFRAFVLPLLLIDCFEIAYLVHKQKSVNFCGISFESGHRAKHKQTLSTCLRFAVWLIGVALFVLNLFAAFYWKHKTSDLESFYHWSDDYMTHAMFCLVPTLVLVVLSLYIGLQLWNYGTFYSYMVHAIAFNPWIWMVVGSLALLTGYLMPKALYPVTSNGGELAMMASIIRMFREVHHDIQQGVQFRSFIDPIPFPIPMDYIVNQPLPNVSAPGLHLHHHGIHNGPAITTTTTMAMAMAGRELQQQQLVMATLTDLENISLPSKQVQKKNHVDLMETKDTPPNTEAYRAMFSPKYETTRHASTPAMYRRASERPYVHANGAINSRNRNSSETPNNKNNKKNNYNNNMEHDSNRKDHDMDQGTIISISKPSPKSDHNNNNNNNNNLENDGREGGASSSVQARMNPLFTIASTDSADQL